jgi:RND family efflux transporter MFP subunit
MNEVERSQAPHTPVQPAPQSEAPGGRKPDTTAPAAGSTHRGRLFFIGVAVLLLGALAIGFWRHYTLHAQVMATAEQRRDFVPSVRVAAVRASGSTRSVSWPGTTEAFAQANINARASGYISRRNVDIGSRVKAGDLLVAITAPEVEHQIAQAEGTLAQLEAALQQAKANRDLARVTWDRDAPLVNEGWVTKQQGDTDRLNLEAREAAVAVAEANVIAQNAQLKVLNQQRDYQSVVAPFDGVITQRNVDIGSLVQADAANGTYLFTLMRSDVIRIQLYVPQDEAFGLVPGVDAVVRVPELPGRDFLGTVTRIADALQPGTRTLLTEIDVPNPDRALSPGVYCNVELRIPRKTPSLIVPSDAVVFNSAGLSVFVVENGVARFHKITVARDFGTTVEVTDGVKDGDVVILNPAVNLTDGQKVEIRPGPPAQLS